VNLSPLGIALIQFFESYSEKAYRKFPNEPWTCGWGHTGVDVTGTTTCTAAQALEWFIADTSIAVAAVIQDIKVPVTQHQFDALVSLVYNLGRVVLEHRTGETWVESTLLKLLNGGNWCRAAQEFIEWDHVNGVPDKGVLRRRQLEQALFLDGVTT
jgi:lysozyme